MAVNTKPTLSSISAFDAEFGTPGKENIEAPILKFSWHDGMARKNRVVIRDYDSNEIVYDCTITTMALKHTLHNIYDTSDKIQAVTYNLQNGHKYIANVYVYTELDGEPSLASNDIVFYCYSTPIFKFINFDSFLSGTNVAVVKNNSINLRVEYNQSDGETLNRYYFTLEDYSGQTLITSDVKYSSNAIDVLRYTLGGIEETEIDKYGDIQPNKAYTIICSGETQHGMVITAKQQFVVHLDSNGVGALLFAENVGDGTVSIVSNYRIINSHCSVGTPVYEYDENGNPYAINLTNGETVEFLDGFIMLDPYEIVMKGLFQQIGELVLFKNADGKIGHISLCEYEYTDPTLYYFSFYMEDGSTTYEIRTDYFNADTLYNCTSMEIDFSYNNHFYNIQARINGEVF